MKTFKQYLTESFNISSINQLFQKYINGSMPDPYENEQDNPKTLFQQLYDIFIDNKLSIDIINPDGKKFNGSNIIVDTNKPYHFNLKDKSGKELPYKLHAEIKKTNDGSYFFSYLKVESI